MTREEAIETLHEIQRDAWPNSYTEKACEMAIKALEQPDQHDDVSYTNVGDMISRQAAIDAVENIDCSDGVGISALKCEAVDDVVTAIKALPSAQPESLVKKKRTLVKDLVNEPCDDAVSREAAIDAALSAFSRGLLASPDIRKLPSVQPEPQWIPVSKKSHPDTPERVQVQLDNGWIITAYYEENEWLSVPYCDEPIEDRWIEAWMPLPEPYREERRTDGN